MYKIDRLTRSLADFAKLVEVFDQYNVSFVSVTQSFNTTTSMGRLTLNVLLSFAQFEREVSGERIRDKIAASKKKGMWMGGHPMLGYDIESRQLVINEQEAKTIQYIFDRYLELGSVTRLKEDLDAKDIKSKSWVAASGKKHLGQTYSRGALYHMLSNPVYAGYIRHQGVLHDGLHQGIISKEKWQQVQDALMSKACIARGSKQQAIKNILKGKIFGVDDIPYTPMRAHKKGKQYRYYVSQNRVQSRHHPENVIARLPAHEIETLVSDATIAQMRDVNKLSSMLSLDIEVHYRLLEHITKIVQSIRDIPTVIKKIIVDTGCLILEISAKDLADHINEMLDIKVPIADADKIYKFSILYHTKRARKGAVVICSGDGKDPLDLPKSKLAALVKGVVWRDEHFSGKSFIEIARENNCSRSFVMQSIQKSLEIG